MRLFSFVFACLLLLMGAMKTMAAPSGIVTAAIWPLNHKKAVGRVLLFPARHPKKTFRHIPPFGF
jgi:hypothetical protein